MVTLWGRGVLNRRQFATYLGLTFVGLATGGLALGKRPRQVFYSENIGAVRLDQGTVQVTRMDGFRTESKFVGQFREGIRWTYQSSDWTVAL